jgi:hypothetical protein
LGDFADDIFVVETRTEESDKSAREMKRRIADYDKDDDGDWRAKLECRHYQHVRHQPPLITREWILTEQGRTSRIGAELNCKKCEEGSPTDFEF